MGSYTTHKPAGVSVKDFLKRRGDLDFRVDGGACRILATAHRGSGFYVAVEVVKGDRRDVTAYIWKAESYKPDSAGHNFEWKCFSEADDPRFVDAPIKLLDLLTPTDNRQANAWRQKCRDNAVRVRELRDLKPGDEILSGVTTFHVEANNGAAGLTVSKGGICYRMPAPQVRRADLIRPTDGGDPTFSLLPVGRVLVTPRASYTVERDLGRLGVIVRSDEDNVHLFSRFDIERFNAPSDRVDVADASNTEAVDADDDADALKENDHATPAACAPR